MSPADVWRKLFSWHKMQLLFTLLPKIKFFFCIISLSTSLSASVCLFLKSISFGTFTICNLFKQMLFCACTAVFWPGGWYFCTYALVFSQTNMFSLPCLTAFSARRVSSNIYCVFSQLQPAVESSHDVDHDQRPVAFTFDRVTILKRQQTPPVENTSQYDIH